MPGPMDPKDLAVTPIAYFSFSKYTKQLFVSNIFWYTCRIWSYFLDRPMDDGRTEEEEEEGQTDLEVEIVI